MNFRNLACFVVVIELLASVLSLTPVRAAGPELAADDAKVIWCPIKVLLPRSSKDGCTPAFDTMSQFLGELARRNPATAGTVWIGKYYDSSPDDFIVFDGATLKRMANYPLNIKGGWNGLKTGSVDLTTPSIFDGASFTVQRWKANITVRNLQIKNATVGAGCDPFNGNSSSVALCISTVGKISLDRVQGQGAFLSNSIPSSYTWPPLIVTNSQFSNSLGNGLYIDSDETVTLTNVQAYDNARNGTEVNGNYTFVKVFLKGTNTFLNNGSAGLRVETMGSISANNLMAYDNGTAGVYIDNSHNGGGPSTMVSPVKVTGAMLKGNGANGLEVWATGSITAKNITATSNANGLSLSSTAATDTLAISLSNVNADLNTYSGSVLYADGKVSVACSSMYGNGAWGLFLRGATNTMGPAAALKLQGFQSLMNFYAPVDVLTTTPLVLTPTCPS